MPVFTVQEYPNNSVSLGRGNQPVGATDGFPYVPITVGLPTGKPTQIAGFAPLTWVDNGGGAGYELQVYSPAAGAWKSAQTIAATQLSQGGGVIAVNTDGSFSMTPASGKNITVGDALDGTTRFQSLNDYWIYMGPTPYTNARSVHINVATQTGIGDGEAFGINGMKLAVGTIDGPSSLMLPWTQLTGDYTQGWYDTFMVYTTLAASHTVTLMPTPPGSGNTQGQFCLVKDGTGNCSATRTITIQVGAGGSDQLIDGHSSIVLNRPYQAVLLYLDASGHTWHTVGQSNFPDGLTAGGPIYLASGTQAAPSLAFTSDIQSGFYDAGGGHIALVEGNTEIVFFSNTQVAFDVPFGNNDVFFTRSSPGLMEVNNGTVGAFRDLQARDLTTNDTANLIISAVALTSGAGSGAGTLTTAPHAGNPDSWLPVKVNGVQGWIPWWHA